jgi:hypothetical protein
LHRRPHASASPAGAGMHRQPRRRRSRPRRPRPWCTPRCAQGPNCRHAPFVHAHRCFFRSSKRVCCLNAQSRRGVVLCCCVALSSLSFSCPVFLDRPVLSISLRHSGLNAPSSPVTLASLVASSCIVFLSRLIFLIRPVLSISLRCSGLNAPSRWLPLSRLLVSSSCLVC